MNKVIIKIKPKIHRGEDGEYSIIDENNKGGAIVWDMDPFKAMEKFKEASHLVVAVRTLMEMSKGMKNFYIAEFI